MINRHVQNTVEAWERSRREYYRVYDAYMASNTGHDEPAQLDALRKIAMANRRALRVCHKYSRLAD